jgi:hypothetical protein
MLLRGMVLVSFWDAYKGRILWKELGLQGVYAGDA